MAQRVREVTPETFDPQQQLEQLREAVGLLRKSKKIAFDQVNDIVQRHLTVKREYTNLVGLFNQREWKKLGIALQVEVDFLINNLCNILAFEVTETLAERERVNLCLAALYTYFLKDLMTITAHYDHEASSMEC
ncbi:MAG: hypothetical protein WBB68_00400 [Candidatus Moraniibacteriota bacterium]